ncbi:MAG: hypothetical protein QMB70_00655 [Aeromonadaceae bacterium]
MARGQIRWRLRKRKIRRARLRHCWLSLPHGGASAAASESLAPGTKNEEPV